MIDPPQKGPRWARDAVNAATARNAKRGTLAQFSLEDLSYVWDKSGGRCAVSGLEFSCERIGIGQARRPFAPSLDRIDPTKPYPRENVRVVAQVANFAVNAWGLSLHRLAQGILGTNGAFTGPQQQSVGPRDEPIVDEPLPIAGEIVDTDRGALVFPQRFDLLWPALAFIRSQEGDSQEIENHLADLFSLGPKLLEAKQLSGMPVWRNLVSFVLVDLGDPHLPPPIARGITRESC